MATIEQQLQRIERKLGNVTQQHVVVRSPDESNETAIARYEQQIGRQLQPEELVTVVISNIPRND